MVRDDFGRGQRLADSDSERRGGAVYKSALDEPGHGVQRVHGLAAQDVLRGLANGPGRVELPVREHRPDLADVPGAAGVEDPHEQGSGAGAASALSGRDAQPQRRVARERRLRAGLERAGRPERGGGGRAAKQASAVQSHGGRDPRGGRHAAAARRQGQDHSGPDVVSDGNAGRRGKATGAAGRGARRRRPGGRWRGGARWSGPGPGRPGRRARG